MPKKRSTKRTRPRHEVCALIPCAGRGTRVGSPVEGKELLLDPVTKRPLIYYSIKLAIANELKPIIIYSSNKTKLRQYIIDEFGPKACIFVKHDPKGWEEWPHSILSSEKHWGRLNVVILPDTRFSNPAVTINAIKEQLKKERKLVSFATINVEDGSKFAVVKPEENGIILTAEKPKKLSGKSAQAWGLIGFTRETGRHLLHAYTMFNAWMGFPKDNVGLLKLEWFKDITRNGIVEEYGEGI
jgi:dTDP-glucose pyrophosphorylase